MEDLVNISAVLHSPEEYSKMGRRRMQNPKIKRTTSRRPEWWFKYKEYRSKNPGDFVEKSHYVGFCDEMGKREAERKMKAIVEAEGVNEPRVLMQSQIKFGDLLDAYQKTVLDGGAVKLVSAITYKCHIKNWIRPAFGHLRLCDVTPQAVEDWANGLVKENANERKLSSRTQHAVVAVFQSVWRKARKWGHTQLASPAEDLGLRSVRDTRSRDIPTPDQYRKIVSLLGQPLSDMAGIAASTAMRISEIRGLTVGAVDIPRRMVWVKQRKDQTDTIDSPKSVDSERPLPLGTMTETIAARIVGKAPIELVFSDSPKYRQCQIILKSAAKSAGFVSEGFGWHSLRGLHATYANPFYNNPRDLRKQMGHANDAMTDRYIRDGSEDFKRREAAVIAYQRWLMGEEEGPVQ